MFSSEAWLSNSSNFYNGVATQSLRFDDGSSAYLNFAPSSSATSATTGTLSFWVKRATLSTNQYVFHAKDTSVSPQPTVGITFNTDDTLSVTQYDGTSPFNANNYDFGLTTSAKFRDVGAWYHFILKIDTTNATEADRFKLYVNGVDTTLNATNPGSGSQDFPSQNQTTAFFQVGNQRWGATVDTNTFYDGYLAETNGIDGTALDPTSFGEFKNGAWIAKAYTGSYGTNGFRLQFNQTGTGTASSSTIGADTSGNDNHFSSSGIVASDCDMPDSPENNFATLNPLYATENANFSEGNLRLDYSSGTFNTAGSTIATGSMKFYAEVLLLNSTTSPAEAGIGIVNADKFAWNTDNANPATGNNGVRYKTQDGGIDNGYGTNGSGATLTSNDILGIACDPINGTLAFYKNGSLQDTVNIDTGLSYTVAMNDASRFTHDVDFVVNYGQDSSFVGNKTAQGNTDDNGIGDFYYSPPSGYLALCTSNLPEPTISPNADTQADDYFNTVLWSGNGTSQSITGVGFQPDFLWIKERNGTGYHALFDAVRGVTKALYSNDTLAESTGTALTSFDSNGFTLSLDISQARTNDNSDTYVSWNWKAGGTGVSNTDGSITSTVSANTDAGFSIVSFTGNKTRGATIGHGLGVKPDMIIMKNRDIAVSWVVWFPNLQANNQLLELNSTGAVLTNTGDPNAWWNNTSPTSSVITLGDYDGINDDLSMIAYCFAEIEGYSKFGTYTGNGSTDGTFVYTGFRPAFIIIKQTNTTNNWIMMDNKRGNINPDLGWLYPDDPSAEDTGSSRYTDFVSNGMKIRNGGTGMNTSGGTYIYMAFAEDPFKYANAR